jgi:hypothetical protein
MRVASFGVYGVCRAGVYRKYHRHQMFAICRQIRGRWYPVSVAISGRKRRALPRGAYVYGPRSPVGGKGRKAYPIDTPKRARAALSRSAQKNTAGSYSTVAKAVRRKYGNSIASVGRKRGTVSKAGYRKRK